MTSTRPRIFYGWLIVLVSAIGLFLGAATHGLFLQRVFQVAGKDFHASRAAVSFAFSLFNIVGALLIPVHWHAHRSFRGEASHPCVHLPLRPRLMFCLVGGECLVAALSSLHSTWSCDGQRPLTCSLWRRDFTLVQSPSGTCAGSVDDGNWGWLHRGSDSRSAPHHQLRLACRVCDLRRRSRPAAAPGYLLPCYRTTPNNAAFNQMETRKVRLHNCSHRTSRV